MVVTPNGDEYPIHGELWIEPVTGRLVKSRMIVENLKASPNASQADAERYRPRITIDTAWARDPALKIWVPVEMNELYVKATEQVTCKARYSNFRLIARAQAVITVKPANPSTRSEMTSGHDSGTPASGLPKDVPTLFRWEVAVVKFLLWLLLFVLCWPIALLALVLYPLVWLITLPFRLVGIAVTGVFELLRAMLMLPARLLGGGR